MTMPHLMNCPHKGGTWCLKCVGEEWDRREAERDALNARIAELERKAKAFDAITGGEIDVRRVPHIGDKFELEWGCTHRDDVRIIRGPDLLTAVEAAIAAKEAADDS